MPTDRRIHAVLGSALPGRREDVGVVLVFEPRRSRIVTETIYDFATLGPDYCIPAVDGLGKVLRILKAARVAAPKEPQALLGRTRRVLALLERAVGAPLILSVRARNRVRFTAWLESGIETIENVTEVRETPEEYVVYRRGVGFPTRLRRADVVRRETVSEEWYQVLDIESP